MANKKITFEEALSKLEESAEILRNSNTSLEDAVKAYSKSSEYYEICKGILENAKQKIEVFNPETGEVSDFND